MRNKKGLKTTTNSYIYRRYLQSNFYCDRSGGIWGRNHNWKEYRTNQWRSYESL